MVQNANLSVGDCPVEDSPASPTTRQDHLNQKPVPLCWRVFWPLNLKHKKRNTQSNGWKIPRHKSIGMFGTNEIGPSNTPKVGDVVRTQGCHPVACSAGVRQNSQSIIYFTLLALNCLCFSTSKFQRIEKLGIPTIRRSIIVLYNCLTTADICIHV